MAYSKVHWKKYLDSSHPTINQYLSVFGDNFIKQTHQRIKQAHKRKLPEIVLIRFKDSDIVSIVKSKHYISVLENLLNLCIKLEKYELCGGIHKTLDLLNSKNKIRIARGVVGKTNPVTLVN
jgi:hypothetical protein